MYGLWYLFIIFAVITIGLYIYIWGANDCDGMAQYVCAAIMTVISLCVLLSCIFDPINAKRDVIEFQYTKEMVEQTVESGSGLENLAITEKVIDMNIWLSEVKAKKEVWNNWCAYDAEDLNELTPIEIVHFD